MSTPQQPDLTPQIVDVTTALQRRERLDDKEKTQALKLKVEIDRLTESEGGAAWGSEKRVDFRR